MNSGTKRELLCSLLITVFSSNQPLSLSPPPNCPVFMHSWDISVLSQLRVTYFLPDLSLSLSLPITLHHSVVALTCFSLLLSLCLFIIPAIRPLVLFHLFSRQLIHRCQLDLSRLLTLIQFHHVRMNVCVVTVIFSLTRRLTVR